VGRTEIKPEFVSTSCLNNWVANTSSSRVCMDNNHVSQIVSLVNPDPVLIKSGIEYELGKYINDVRTDYDYVVKAIIPKYPNHRQNQPPEISVLCEFEKNGITYLDIIQITSYKSSHNFFGYQQHLTEEFNNIGYNNIIPKDTILARTNSLAEDGSYKYGINANVALMSHPSVSEDGFVISESFRERSKFTSVIKRVINLTKGNIPVNLYGNRELFKFLPDIGDKVREDGLLCAIRERNDWFSIADSNTSSLSEIDFIFDTPIYVTPGSVVVDINIVKGNYNKNEFTDRMTEQLDNYASELIVYYSTIIKRFEEIINEKKLIFKDLSGFKITPRLHRYITDIQIKVNATTSNKIKLCYRKLPIDQYRIEVVTMAVVKLDLGFKLSGTFGDKGVITKILPDKDMPIDELGNRADIITDNMATISRMNIGRAYQVYLSAYSRDNKHRLQNYFFNKYGTDFKYKVIKEDLDYFKKYMTDMYGLINSDLVKFINSLNEEELLNHLVECLTKDIYLYYPPDNEKNIVDIIEDIEKTPYKPHYGKVSYTDELGNRITTKDNIRIGKLYTMVLEKVAMDYAAVNSAKVNNFGFPVKATNIDKYKYPHSITPTKTLGETEVRIITSYSDSAVIADLFDLNLNPVSHKLLIKHMLESDIPFDPTYDIDRSVVEYGNTKSLAILSHMFNVAGFSYYAT